MDFVAPDAKVCGGCLSVPIGNARQIVTNARHFPPVLRSIVFICQP